MDISNNNQQNNKIKIKISKIIEDDVKNLSSKLRKN